MEQLIERERFLGAGHYERTVKRQGYANGTKPKRIDTPAGTVNCVTARRNRTNGRATRIELLFYRIDVLSVNLDEVF